MPVGVIFAVSAYALYSCCDAIIKGLGSGLSVYEIAFFTTLFSLVPALFATPKGENWLTFWKVKHPRLVHLRGLSGVIGNLSIIYAFVTIPLAEAYSIAFLAPIFIVAISVVVLKETVSLQRWLLLGASFIGVLIVVRPGFRELHLGHVAAVVAAVAGAVTTTVLRRISRDEKRTSLIGVASTYILVVNGTLMLATGNFQPLHWQELALIADHWGAGRNRKPALYRRDPGGAGQPDCAAPVQPDFLGHHVRRGLLPRIPRWACLCGRRGHRHCRHSRCCQRGRAHAHLLAQCAGRRRTIDHPRSRTRGGHSARHASGRPIAGAAEITQSER